MTSFKLDIAKKECARFFARMIPVTSLESHMTSIQHVVTAKILNQIHPDKSIIEHANESKVVVHMTAHDGREYCVVVIPTYSADDERTWLVEHILSRSLAQFLGEITS